MPLPLGDAEMSFDLFVQSKDTLFIEPIFYRLKFVGVGSAE